MNVNEKNLQLDLTESDAGERSCARCEAHFECGVLAGTAHCWCFELPHIMPIVEDAAPGCLCPQCLYEVIDAIQRRQP